MISTIAIAVILVTGITGLLGASGASLLAGAALLAAISLTERCYHRISFASVAMADAGVSLAAASGAYALGCGVRFAMIG